MSSLFKSQLFSSNAAPSSALYNARYISVKVTSEQSCEENVCNGCLHEKKPPLREIHEPGDAAYPVSEKGF